MIRVIFLTLLFSSSTPRLFSQSVLSDAEHPLLTIIASMDLYYCYDFNKPSGVQRQPFLFNYNRHNMPNLNLGLIKASVKENRYRLNAGFHIGSYVTDNYSQETSALRFISEANIGFTPIAKSNIWIDAGIMSSHIGFESALSVDNITLTRSLIAESSPYFLTGVKITYTPSDKWEAMIMVCNGWQRIRSVSGNTLPSFGTQLRYTPSSKVTFNWSSFTGTDDPDTIRRIRFFNNLYSTLSLTDKWILVAGFDIGIQQTSRKSRSFNPWFGTSVITRYLISKQWALALRGEYYHDPHGIIISNTGWYGFQSTGLSLNIDFNPYKDLTCRVEGRWLHGKHAIFRKEGSGYSRDNAFITAAISFYFSRDIKITKH